MTGIEKISSRIEADARAEAERLVSVAQAEAAEITARYEKQAADLAKELERKSEEQAEEHIRRAVGVAELDARKRLLAAKQEMIGKSFDSASGALASLPEDELVALLARRAAGSSKDGTEQIILTPADHNRFGKKICENANTLLKNQGKNAALTLSSNPRPIPGGGLILSGGKVEVNCGFTSYMDGLRHEIVADVAAKLGF